MTPHVYAQESPEGVLAAHAAFTLPRDASCGEGDGAPPYFAAVANSVTLYSKGLYAGLNVGDALGSVGGVGERVVGDAEVGYAVGRAVCADDGRVGAADGESVFGTVLKHAHTARYAWLHSVTLVPKGVLYHWNVFVPV